MSRYLEFVKTLPGAEHPERYDVYPDSVNRLADGFVFMIREPEADYLVATGEPVLAFSGTVCDVAGTPCVRAPLDHVNAAVLRMLFPFTAPVPVLTRKRTFGLGDRLGIAGPGHARVFRDYDAAPVFAQQSIRELTLTNRTYEQVLDAATYAVFRAGYRGGFGADGDHLKKPSEIEYALRVGYTMITLDCSEHIRNDVASLSKAEVSAQCALPAELAERYLGKAFTVEGHVLRFDEDALRRNVLVYGKAIDFAVAMYETYFAGGKTAADYEISIDETSTPTSPAQHYFVASELIRRGVRPATLAPRFCGEFQKGVDYVGDLAAFTRELAVHAAIARKFGYKLSIHSGSDKFSVFPLIGKHTRGNFHVKTAGTSWLEAMRLVAVADPALYREVHAFALTAFPEAKKYYHVTTDLAKIPPLSSLQDGELPGLFDQNDARQLIHITYGLILNAKDEAGGWRFKNRLFALWRIHADAYADLLHRHIGKHLELLYAGFRDTEPASSVRR